MANSFKLAHAQGDSWHQLLENCWQQLNVSVLDNPYTLGFIYVTDPLAKDFPQLIAWLRDRLPDTQWVGSVALRICATDSIYTQKPAISLLLSDFSPDDFQVFNTISENLDHFHQQHQHWYQEQQTLFGVVHGDPRNAQIPELIEELPTVVDHAFLVGGLTSADKHYWQVANKPTQGGLSGVLFSSQVPVMTRISQGCYPIGDEYYEVTDCHNNIIKKINNRPALDVFMDVVGKEIQHDLFKIVGRIFIGLPIVGSDSNAYLIRPLLGIDPHKRYIAVADLVEAGTHVVFTQRNEQQARDDMQRMLNELKQQLPHPPKGGLYHSCLGRGDPLFEKDNSELHMIKQTLGDFPLTGFFANGEVYHQYLYGYSGILTLFY